MEQGIDSLVYMNQIGSHAFSLCDRDQDYFYVVEGREIAAVIDTGISIGAKIRPAIETLTKKPLVLILTHAHIDHFHHMDEFDTVYMCHEELTISRDILKGMMCGKDLDIENTVDIRTNDVIDLGGEKLEICQVPGHTPGSVVILAKEQNLLFTGDAIGSGCGVWLQSPGSMPLASYYSSLVFLQKWLVDRGGRMKFYGGHNLQQFQSALVLQYNPLGMGLLADLIDLVHKIIQGEIVGRDSGVEKRFGLEPTRYASFGRAEIQYLQSRIR